MRKFDYGAITTSTSRPPSTGRLEQRGAGNAERAIRSFGNLWLFSIKKLRRSQSQNIDAIVLHPLATHAWNIMAVSAHLGAR